MVTFNATEQVTYELAYPWAVSRADDRVQAWWSLYCPVMIRNALIAATFDFMDGRARRLVGPVTYRSPQIARPATSDCSEASLLVASEERSADDIFGHLSCRSPRSSLGARVLT
jgi:hypothetical protein